MTDDGASIAGLHARLVEDPSDLIGLRTALESASGRIVSAQRGVGDELLLRIQPYTGVEGGDWRVGTQASDWVLASASFVLAGAHASREAVDAALAELRGTEVTRLEVTKALALVVVLADGRWLEVQGDVNDPDERDDDPPYWEVFSPSDEVIRAGPGPIWLRTASRVRPVDELPRIDVDHLATDELLALWSTVTAELRRRGVVRHSASALGDVAEELVRGHFRGFRGSYADAGWDVLSDAGERIEVKALQMRGASKRLPALPVRDGEFDAVVIVLFDEAHTVRDAWHVPREALLRLGATVADRVGPRRLPLRRVVDDPSVTSLNLG